MSKDSADWIKMQSWFFDKVLKKEGKTRLRLKPLASDNAQGGYLAPKTGVTRVDYQDALFDASRSMIRFRKPHRLIKMIDRIINMKVGVTHSAILIYDNDKKSYVLVYNKSAQEKKATANFVRLDLKSSLIRLFCDNRNPYLFENGVITSKGLKWILESGQLLTKDASFLNRLQSALKEMELLNAELCIPCFFKKELLGILILGKKLTGQGFTRHEMNLFATLANDAAMALANARLIEKLRKKVDEVGHLYEKEHRLFINTAFALAKAIDARDIYTHGHTERVTEYCLAIVDELGDIPEIRLDKRFRETLHIAALLHDIGKIGVPDRVLNKKGILNTAERNIVERHPEIGASILFPISELSEVAKCVRLHQEWYNGNGYPDKLKRDEIPIISRIVSIADAFDAITSDRPYRKKRSRETAVEEIKKYSGTQFDPEIVDTFLNAYRKGLIDINNQYKKNSILPHSSTFRFSKEDSSTLFE
jgi:HD-GYP domain-containing protein (c-di-GMP phosphodiesterase class II)